MDIKIHSQHGLSKNEFDSSAIKEK